MTKDKKTQDKPEKRAPATDDSDTDCADGMHGCDVHSTECVSFAVPQAGETMQVAMVVTCVCLQGLIPDPVNVSRCLGCCRPLCWYGY